MGDDVAMSGELWGITGANGYLGRALRADLDATGIPWRALGGDIRDRAAVAGLVRGTGVIVHLAAYVHRRTWTRARREACWSVNVEGMQTLLDAVAAEAPEAFVVFASSASVYGNGETAFDESSPLQPRTVYGRAKAEAERRLLDAVAHGRARGCVLRPAVIFGPGAPGNMALLARMVRSGWVAEIGGGAQRKSIVPVSHAVAAVRAVAAHREASNGEVFNVAGETLTIHEIIDVMGGARRIPIPRWLGARLMPAYATSATLADGKLARATGFAPAEPVAGALRAISARG